MTIMKTPLTPEELAECAALKAIFTARKHESGLTQEAAADFLGFKTQGAVSQYLNGKLALNLNAATGFAKLLKVQVSDFSARLANRLPESAKEPSPAYKLELVSVWDDETPLDDDEVELPLYKSAEFSSGPGRAQHVEKSDRKLRYGKRTLRNAGVDAASAAGGKNIGDSNAPLILDGAMVMIDTSKKEIVDAEPYALDHGGEFRVKFLYKLPGGGLRLRSHNREEYPDEDYGPDWSERISIIGWVWTWEPPIRKWRGK